MLSPSTLLVLVMLLPTPCLNPPVVPIPVNCILFLSTGGAPSTVGPTGPEDLILRTGPCLGPSEVLLLPSLPPCLLSEEEVLLAPG